MKSEDLFREIGNIDESFIEECSDVEAKKEVHAMKKNFWKYAAVAAGFIVVTGGFVAVAGAGLNLVRYGSFFGKTEVETLIDVAMPTTSQDLLLETELSTYVLSKDLVYFDGNTYINQTNEEAEKGELLGVAEQSTEYGYSDYEGCPVYLVDGCKSKMKIVVEKDGKFLLYKLWSWGYEHDMAGYKDMYGITEAEDIVSVVLKWNYDKETYKYLNIVTLTTDSDKAAIGEFYNALNALVLDETGYTAIVDKISAEDLAAWRAGGGDQVYEDETGKYTLPYTGTTAFNNNISIHIETKDGETMQFDYYPKIEYMNRFKATEELKAWLDSYCK